MSAPAFFRFPHTPHLAWLGDGEPRDDKVMTREERDALLSHALVVEEKVDGANLGFSIDEEGELRVQNRGTYLTPETSHPQFRPLWQWLVPRHEALAEALFPDLMLFGEWCFAVHSVEYDRLPDYFLGFDVYDRSQERFWSKQRRNQLLKQVGLTSIPQKGEGHFTLSRLTGLLMADMTGLSNVGKNPAEGLYVRVEEEGWLVARAKLVRPTFVQAIGEHWSRGALRRNLLQPPS